eukprot:7949398-Pyramimonas_sp.AAC.2
MCLLWKHVDVKLAFACDLHAGPARVHNRARISTREDAPGLEAFTSDCLMYRAVHMLGVPFDVEQLPCGPLAEGGVHIPVPSPVRINVTGSIPVVIKLERLTYLLTYLPDKPKNPKEGVLRLRAHAAMTIGSKHIKCGPNNSMLHLDLFKHLSSNKGLRKTVVCASVADRAGGRFKPVRAS